MKRTSIFFLVVSVALILCGIILINMATTRAENEKVELFRQNLNKNGDLVETIDFPADSINKINISLEDTNVNIIGGNKRCFVEIVNFNAIEYSAYVNNRSFTVENDIMSAIINRAEGGSISFNGVRDYLRKLDYNEQRTINIYISDTSAVKIFDIKLNNGNITVDKANITCDYTLSLNEGNITFKNTPNISLLKAEVNKGNINIKNAHISHTDVSIQNGDLSFSTASNLIYDFSVTNRSGDIKYNKESFKGTFTLVNDEINGKFTAKVGVGKVVIKTDEAPIVQQEPEPPTDSAPTETTENTTN